MFYLKINISKFLQINEIKFLINKKKLQISTNLVFNQLHFNINLQFWTRRFVVLHEISESKKRNKIKNVKRYLQRKWHEQLLCSRGEGEGVSQVAIQVDHLFERERERKIKCFYP